MIVLVIDWKRECLKMDRLIQQYKVITSSCMKSITNAVLQMQLILQSSCSTTIAFDVVV